MTNNRSIVEAHADELETTMEKFLPALSEKKMTDQKFPPGWDEGRVKRILEHYESQEELEALAEDEAAFEAEGQTVVVVPSGLVSKIRELIAKHGAA